MDFTEREIKSSRGLLFRRPWAVERCPSECRFLFERFMGRGGGWVVAQGLLMLCWLFLTPKGHKLTGSALARTFAAVLLTTGVVAGVSGALVLGKSLTPFPKPPAQAQLVRRGVYAMVRHPVYAGLMALSLGWACLWRSLPGAALALIQAVLLDAKARREERWLREKFPGYGEYAAKVRRLIPWVY